MVRSGAATATVGGYLAFTNDASIRCHLTGWPDLVSLTATGTSATAVRKLTTMFGPYLKSVLVVTIQPGATAEAVFTGGDTGPGAGRCPPPYRLLRVTPPGNTRSAVISAWLPYLGAYLPACTPIWVSPVAPFADLYNG